MKKHFKKGWIAIILCCWAWVSYAQPNITRVEYYVDTDPGYGNGISITIPTSNNLADQTFNINPASFTAGVHILAIRAKDANGAWSHDNKWAFVKAYPSLPGGNPIGNITKVEYYVDTDPGFGNATNVSIAPGTNLSDITVNLDPSTFISGIHQIGIRAKAANGAWSHDNKWLFLKPFNSLPNNDSVSLIAQVEYYIDADPGYGKGIPVAIPASKNLTDIQVSTNVTGLAAGKHAIFIRAKNAYGKWSHDNTDSFNIASLISSPSITVNSIASKLSNCARDSFDISYHVTGTYNAGNKFNVELSDATGSFGTPVNIGYYTGTGNSIIKVKLPSHLAEGSGYKVRVSSTNPVVTGTASTSVIIHDRPNAPTITGAANANATYSYPYSVTSVTGSTWAWISSAATIAQTANSANLTWNIAAQPDSVQVIETNQYGCVGDTGLEKVNVYSLKVDNVAASSLTPCPDGTITVTGNATGVYDAANKFTAQLSGASGSFSSPVTIGTVTANPVGLSQPVSITATLPFPLVNGAGYRVRIVASSPSVTGSDNGQNIVVNKPNLGADTSTTISCANGTADITTLYNTTGLTAVYSATTPTAAVPGVYNLFVTNTNGCKDTAIITVQDASTATVPTAGSNIKTANRECTDAVGWTHYYYDNGTPTDYSDDIRLLSIKKNGNNIGTIGDGTFQLKVAATAGAGTNHAVKVNSALISSDTTFYSMNRYWNITPTTQPTSSVGVRFYYNTQDLADINGNDPGVVQTQLIMYKLKDGNPDPTTNWAGATADNFYSNGSTADLKTWVYTDLGNNRHQAEFLVSSFSGGGAGAVLLSALPVTFVSFNAIVTNDKVELLWTTATEINSKEFIVQRSLDGTTFETIGTLAAAGNSNIFRSYEYDDMQGITLKGQQLFYRIVETDIDGQDLYTNIKNVKIPDDKNNLKLVYNPVTNQALLRYTCVANAHIQVRVVDHLGRVISVIEQTVQAGVNDIKLQTGNLAKGIYEIELSSNQDQEHVRMMKE